MTRVLVLGGGGFIGSAIVAACAARGWAVVAATRTGGFRENISENIEIYSGDDSEPEVVRNWVGGKDLVIDAAAPYALTLNHAGETHARRIASAKARMNVVLDAAARAGAALIHVGSFVTTTPPETAVDRAVRASHPYFAMKDTMTDACIAAAASGSPVGVVAPTALFGPGDMRADAQSFVGSILSGALKAAPTNEINVLDVRDAAEAAIRAYETGWFGAPIAVSGHNITASALGELIARLGGVRPPIASPGLAIGAAALYAGEMAAGLVGLKTPPSLPALLTLAAKPAEISPAQRALGVSPRSLTDTISEEIKWRKSIFSPSGSNSIRSD